MIGPYEYVVESISGEYAFLKRTDIYDRGEPYMIALARLSEGTQVGSKIRFENLQYSIIG